MADEYNKFLKQSLDLKHAREERHRDLSRDKLFKAAKKKIQTTMIGALARFEENFGHLWGHFKDPSEPLTPEEEKFADTWDYTRNQILNQGNSQIRNLSKDLGAFSRGRIWGFFQG